MSLQLKLIAAACENMGIGKNNALPWKLRREMAYFQHMTQTTSDSRKTNAVVMGRRTWQSIPPKYQPLSNRINIVLTRHNAKDIEGPDYVVNSFDACIDLLKSAPLVDHIESVWVIGGEQIYRTAMQSPYCSKIYLTRIMANFDCDAFFPPIPTDSFKKISEDNILSEIQEENDIKYQFEVYSKIES